MLCGRSVDDREADTPFANGNAIEIYAEIKRTDHSVVLIKEGFFRNLQKYCLSLVLIVNADHDFLPFPRPDQARGNLGLEYKISSIFPLSRLRVTNG